MCSGAHEGRKRRTERCAVRQGRRWFQHAVGEAFIIALSEKMNFEFGELFHHPAVAVLESPQDPTQDKL